MSKSRDKNGAASGGTEGCVAESCPEDMSYDWDSLRKMFNPRVFATPVIHGKTIYLVGGCDNMGQPVDIFEMFEKKRWHSLPSMPTKRANPAVGLVGDKIVVIGGVGTGQKPVTAVEVYDINEGKWVQMEGLVEGLLGVSSVVRDGKVLAVGGMATDTNPRDYFRSFDVEANRWKALSPMPTPRYATFSFLIKDKFYVIGGRQGKLPCVAFEVYDFKEEKWEKLPDVPSKRVFALYTHTECHIFSMGGLIQPGTEGFSNACEIFDLEKKQWTIGKSMPTKRGDFAIGILNDKVICAGGLGNMGKPLDVVEAYDFATDSWTKLRSMPSTHCSCAYTLFEGKFYVFGGLTVQGPGTCSECLYLRGDDD
ncbi:hypothetical protein CHS0354_030803 [Potamilus streckersoni]|uniref:Kelch repeat-containing protein n=1 Tax=Potamilus streckersoni TaxID=2493646 RepID=A0AAE0TEQ5_9BIVA|nr:hypothetical protein CHS0354_030803 [Potamilus streckersoni]